MFERMKESNPNFNTSPSTRGFMHFLLPKFEDRFQYQPLHEGLRKNGEVSDDFDISIPAPPRGASRACRGVSAASHFNTSPSTRGFFSIPAPPRGASMICDVLDIDYEISIPAPPRGASKRILFGRISFLFQYQPLHEGLQAACMAIRARSNFNTSPSTRGFSNSSCRVSRLIFQYQPLHEGLRK